MGRRNTVTIRLFDQSVLDRAEAFATIKHKGQKRKYGGADYITHPARVAKLVAGHRLATTDMVAGAWLHDVVEDCGVSFMEIYEVFGSGVLNIVDPLTKRDGVPKRVYYESFPDQPEEVCVVKLYDRLDNVSDLHMADKDFREYYKRDTARLLKYVRWADEEIATQIERRLEKV